MKKYALGICGSFGGKAKTFDGQTIKTQNLTVQIGKILGKDAIASINSHYWKKNPIKFFFDCVLLSRSSQCILMMPAQNGIRLFAPLFLTLKKIFHNRLYYSVIGGWLPELVAKKKHLEKYLKKFDEIFVETSTMKNQLEKIGFRNISIIPNFKMLEPIRKEALNQNVSKPFKLCSFSRVMEEKGILDAAKMIVRLNNALGECAFTLDIYGIIDEKYKTVFNVEICELPDYIQYKGYIDSSESVAVLSQYFAQIFPTKFYTEGLPGSIIDGFFAGVPVIASHWASCEDIVEDMKNGIVYEFGNIDEFYKKLLLIYQSPSILTNMKAYCLKCSENYSPQKITLMILQRMKLND